MGKELGIEPNIESGDASSNVSGRKSDDECLIVDIYWERIFLHIKLEGALGKKLFLRGRNSYGFVALEQEPIEEGFDASEIVLNLSTVVNRTFMENGVWQMGYFDTEEQPRALNDEVLYPDRPKRIKRQTNEMAEHNAEFLKPESKEDRLDIMRFCNLSEKVVRKLEDLDKVYRYSGTKYAYTVTFNVFSSGDEHLHLRLFSYFTMVNEKWDKRRPGFETKTFLGGIRRRLLGVNRRIINLLYVFFCLFHPRKERNVLLLSETGMSFQGNLARIHHRIKERGLDREFKIDTSCREAVGKHNSNFSWFKLIAKIAAAGVIIVDNYAPVLTYLNLDKKTKIAQVWHAGAGFKGVGYMRFGKGGSPFPAESVHKKYALALAPSEPLIRVFEEVFGIEKEAFLPVGMPRLDNYLEPAKIKAFKEDFYRKYPDLEGKRIILFAPTYRGTGQKTAHYDYTKIDFARLYEFCGADSVVLLKMHPFTKDTIEHYEKSNLKQSNRKLWDERVRVRVKPDLSPYAPRILDFASFPDINELFYVTDVFITDYSSAYYEFSIFKRPILFYVFDRLRYENVRGVYQKIHESAPGKVCDTFDELLDALKSEDFELEKTIAFSESHFPDKLEGATDALLDKLLFPEKA